MVRKPLPAKKIVSQMAVGLAVGALAVAHAATASAEPPPGDDTAAVAPAAEAPAPVAPSGPAMGGLGRLGAAQSPGGLDFLLSQYAVPAAPGAAPVVAPDLSVLDAGQFLNPRNYRVPSQDQVSPYPLAPATPGPFARVDALRGTHAMVHGALGRMPLDQLSQPLPGTAPPAGTRLPVGPVQNLPGLSDLPALPAPPELPQQAAPLVNPPPTEPPPPLPAPPG